MHSARSYRPCLPLAKQNRRGGQLLASLILGLGTPLAAYIALYMAGHNSGDAVYALALASVVLDLALIALAGLSLIRAAQRRRWPDPSYPPASAILVTEAESAPSAVEASARALLRAAYRSPVQVIVSCCNSEQVRALEYLRWQHGDRLYISYPPRATIAAQMRAAFPIVTGQVVGVFRAGQEPFHDGFLRAWFWLSRGCAAIRGGCLPGDLSTKRVARIEAIEYGAAGIVPPPVCGPEDAWRGCVEGDIYLPADLLRRIVTRLPAAASADAAPRTPPAGSLTGAGVLSGKSTCTRHESGSRSVGPLASRPRGAVTLCSVPCLPGSRPTHGCRCRFPLQ